VFYSQFVTSRSGGNLTTDLFYYLSTNGGAWNFGEFVLNLQVRQLQPYNIISNQIIY
jgi:hypothetical protein